MKEIIPIGSIVYLKNGSQKLMILNRGCKLQQNDEEVFFDYSAAIYPLGMNPEKIYYFNQEDIDKVVFEGYRDEDEERFVELYNKWKDANKTLLKMGKTH